MNLKVYLSTLGGLSYSSWFEFALFALFDIRLFDIDIKFRHVLCVLACELVAYSGVIILKSLKSLKSFEIIESMFFVETFC